MIRRNFATSAIAVFIFGLCIIGGGRCNASANVVGVIVDQNGAPIATAGVGCASGNKPITHGIEPVDLRGRFRFSINMSATHLTCTFSAPSYEESTRTVPNINDTFDMSEIRLSKIVRLAATPLVRSLTADSKYLILDTIISNPTALPADIVSLHVNATARLSTGCFDPRPAIIFKIKDSAPIKRTSEPVSLLPVDIESPPKNWTENAMVKGRLEKLGCSQEKLTIDADYLARFEPGDHEKVRIAMPQRIAVEGASPVQLTLSAWEAIEVKLLLADGTTLSTSMKK